MTSITLGTIRYYFTRIGYKNRIKHTKKKGIFFPKKVVGIILGLTVFLLVYFLPTPEGMTPQAKKIAAIGLFMAISWITESLPLAATSLIPIIAFPLLGILDSKKTAAAYMDQNVMLFMGGFFIAMAIQKWKLHKRIALWIISLVGTNPKSLILGFMLASAFLSMWISNTATTLMMLPIAFAVADHFRSNITSSTKQSEKAVKNFSIALMLSIAYASSIGGVGTLVGTPPNIIFAGTFHQLFPDKPQIGFLQWMTLGLPVVFVLLPICWIYLTSFAFKLDKVKSLSESGGSIAVIQEEVRKLGKMNKGEKLTLFFFFLTAAMWIFRQPINLGFLIIPGWSSLFPIPNFIHDSTVAILVAVLMFGIPVDLKKKEYLLDWDWAKRIPWEILLLFGGGFALASGIQKSGLADWIGGHLGFLSHIPTFLMVASICTIMTFLSEITSNSAITMIMMPILAATALKTGINPYLMMIPGTIAASLVFMLPVATPPNSIVFASGFVKIPLMAKVGSKLNLIGISVATLCCYIFIEWFIPID